VRPIYDLASAFAAQIFQAEEEAGRVYEAMIGIVTDNKDPQRLGRVRIKYPVLSEQDASWWAPIVMLGAGKNRGWFFIPEVKDEVLVMFEHGDMNRPIIVGSLWNGKDKPADKNPGGNPRRVIKSRQGSKIIFDDDQMTLVIEDGTGKGRITLDANANKIVIEALDGDVCFQAPKGEMKIVAKSADFIAKQSIEIHAGTSMAWGSDASVKINGSGGVTISGAKVNMNCGTARAPVPPTADPKDVPDPYEGRGPGAEATAPAPAPARTSPEKPSPTTSRGGPTSASHNSTSALPPLEPQPVLISAKWAQARAPVSTSIMLSAICADISGKPATFTIRDADDENAVVATINATCGDTGVETTWATPSSGPPGRFVFEVAADGKQASSGLLTLINAVEVKLMLDDEPAEGVRARLRVEPSREEVTAEADANGVVRFPEAPFGDYTLLLDE
jgi:hypothetical protein